MVNVLTKPPVADRVRDARANAGLTAADLARAAGVAVQTIHGIEQGLVRRPRAVTLGRLAAAFGCSVAFLEGREPAPTTNGAQPSASGSEGV